MNRVERLYTNDETPGWFGCMCYDSIMSHTSIDMWGKLGSLEPLVSSDWFYH